MPTGFASNDTDDLAIDVQQVVSPTVTGIHDHFPNGVAPMVDQVPLVRITDVPTRAQAAVTADQTVVAAEVTNAARDSVAFAMMVAAAEYNLAGNGGDPVATFVADTGYWSIDNATLDIDAEVLITPMPATGGVTDPDDPRIARRIGVIERLDRAEITVKAAATEMGVSTTTVRKWLNNHRSGRPDPVAVRHAMGQRLATEHGAAAYAKRKTTVETVFGNVKANLKFRRFSRGGLDATSSEWRLICAARNLLKIHRHQLAAT